MEFKDWKKTGNKLVDYQRLVESDGNIICRLDGSDFSTDEEMDNAACLISAAPELLEALQALQDQFKEMILDEGIDVDEGDTQAFNQATKAINKALNQ